MVLAGRLGVPTGATGQMGRLDARNFIVEKNDLPLKSGGGIQKRLGPMSPPSRGFQPSSRAVVSLRNTGDEILSSSYDLRKKITLKNTGPAMNGSVNINPSRALTNVNGPQAAGIANRLGAPSRTGDLRGALESRNPLARKSDGDLGVSRRADDDLKVSRRADDDLRVSRRADEDLKVSIRQDVSPEQLARDNPIEINIHQNVRRPPARPAQKLVVNRGAPEPESYYGMPEYGSYGGGPEMQPPPMQYQQRELPPWQPQQYQGYGFREPAAAAPARMGSYRMEPAPPRMTNYVLPPREPRIAEFAMAPRESPRMAMPRESSRMAMPHESSRMAVPRESARMGYGVAPESSSSWRSSGLLQEPYPQYEEPLLMSVSLKNNLASRPPPPPPPFASNRNAARDGGLPPLHVQYIDPVLAEHVRQLTPAAPADLSMHSLVVTPVTTSRSLNERFSTLLNVHM